MNKMSRTTGVKMNIVFKRKSQWTSHHGHKTQNEDKQSKNTTQKAEIMSNTDSIGKPGINSGAHEG
jgi:hypothetical protein